MEGLNFFHAHVKNLYHRAKKLTSTGLSLVTLFAEEATRLSREDEASRLRALCFSVRRQLYWAKSNEGSASYAHSQANLIISLGGLAAGGIIKMVSRNKQLSAFADYLLKSPTNKERPFGLVLICIGPKGLPADVQVISISWLARESNRLESEVIHALQERGYLLLSENAFSLLIDRLIDDIQEGRLLLPVSVEKLSKITASSLIRLESEN